MGTSAHADHVETTGTVTVRSPWSVVLLAAIVVGGVVAWTLLVRAGRDASASLGLPAALSLIALPALAPPVYWREFSRQRPVRLGADATGLWLSGRWIPRGRLRWVALWHHTGEPSCLHLARGGVRPPLELRVDDPVAASRIVSLLALEPGRQRAVVWLGLPIWRRPFRAFLFFLGSWALLFPALLFAPPAGIALLLAMAAALLPARMTVGPDGVVLRLFLRRPLRLGFAELVRVTVEARASGRYSIHCVSLQTATHGTIAVPVGGTILAGRLRAFAAVRHLEAAIEAAGAAARSGPTSAPRPLATDVRRSRPSLGDG